MLFDLSHPDGGRSLDRIESVLNRDHKQATYKLALFRALAEIAISNYSLATWHTDGMVSLPIAALAERWVGYYWPIVASQTHIPQNYGQPIAFRKKLSELIQCYDQAGGLSGFAMDCRNERLPEEAKRLYGKLLSSVKQTIKVGPVQYAGGGGTETQVFSYDTATRSVVMDRSKRKEITVAGPYLYRSVANACTDLLRRRSTGVVVREDVGVEELLDHGDNPSHGIEAADEFQRAEKLLGQLPQAQAEVVRLRLIEGLRLNEIADVVGCSVNTVSSRLRYAFQKLRNLVAAIRE
jgi:RNA polymerase sigma factor (sigma-70 family)